jgi:hypothetical protein
MPGSIMNPHVVTLANSFYVGAALVGVPSLVITAWYAVFRFRLWMTPPTPTADSFNSIKNPDAVLLVLGGMARGIGAAANFLGSLGQGIFALFAVLGSVGLVLSITLFFTARGLHAHAAWARGMGGVLMTLVLLIALLSLTVLRGPLMLLSMSVAAASGYALWTLWRGFAL